MKKRIYSAAMAATLATLLAACTSTSSSTGSGASAQAPGASALKNAKGVTNITFWHGVSAVNGEELTKLVNQFNAQNKGSIHVTATFQGGYADLLAKYTASIRDKSSPTVLLASDIGTGFLTDVKQSIPAADMAKANPGDLDLADLVPAARNYYTVNGKQQAVPMNVSTPVLWVNRDLLNKAGISDSSLSTIDGVVAAAKTLASKTGQKGFTMPDDDWYFEQMTANSGQEFCSPDNGRAGKAPTKITINTGAAKEAITKIASLYTGGVAVDGSPDGSTAISAFQAGKVGMMLSSSGTLSILKTGTKFKYDALPFPTGASNSKAGPVIGGAALWLSATASKAQQVAGWKFESYLASAAAQEQFSQATGYIPTNTAVAGTASQKAFLAANPTYAKFPKLVGNTPVNSVTSGCVTGAMTAIRTANVGEMQAIFAGTKSVGSALDSAAAKAETALKQYSEQLGK
ncbi:ABC transporter substrate-binding protein [Streptomyces sp. NPDC091280]|uniref:ABC transporter substrate-binding protein n=1 Tax=Streptomyces sp. NPDC091280 TaxID=3365984 RepID=UPI0037FBF6FB